MSPHERPIVTEANEEAVRAGSTGHHVRYVLIASCALVIIGFAIIALKIVLLLSTPVYLLQYATENLPDFQRVEHYISSAVLDRSATRKEAVV